MLRPLLCLRKASSAIVGPPTAVGLEFHPRGPGETLKMPGASGFRMTLKPRSAALQLEKPWPRGLRSCVRSLFHLILISKRCERAPWKQPGWVRRRSVLRPAWPGAQERSSESGSRGAQRWCQARRGAGAGDPIGRRAAEQCREHRGHGERPRRRAVGGGRWAAHPRLGGPRTRSLQALCLLLQGAF